MKKQTWIEHIKELSGLIPPSQGEAVIMPIRQ